MYRRFRFILVFRTYTKIGRRKVRISLYFKTVPGEHNDEFISIILLRYFKDIVQTLFDYMLEWLVSKIIWLIFCKSKSQTINLIFGNADAANKAIAKQVYVIFTYV